MSTFEINKIDLSDAEIFLVRVPEKTSESRRQKIKQTIREKLNHTSRADLPILVFDNQVELALFTG